TGMDSTKLIKSFRRVQRTLLQKGSLVPEGPPEAKPAYDKP
ncbi:hypothetical protein ADUPG1_003954, partial [Aduncisulcus paluster]